MGKEEAEKLLLGFAVLLLLLLPPAFHASPAATAQVICNATLEGLAACRPAVTEPNPAAPSAVCCATIRGADLPCLCAYMNSNAALLKYFGIDHDLAAQLPAKCGVAAPETC